MSIYTIISSPLDRDRARRATTVTLTDEAITEGVRAGLLKAFIPLATGGGAFVEVDAGSEGEARVLLDSLAYVTADGGRGEVAMAA